MNLLPLRQRKRAGQGLACRPPLLFARRRVVGSGLEGQAANLPDTVTAAPISPSLPRSEQRPAPVSSRPSSNALLA